MEKNSLTIIIPWWSSYSHWKNMPLILFQDYPSTIMWLSVLYWIYHDNMIYHIHNIYIYPHISYSPIIAMIIRIMTSLTERSPQRPFAGLPADSEVPGSSVAPERHLPTGLGLGFHHGFHHVSPVLTWPNVARCGRNVAGFFLNSFVKICVALWQPHQEWDVDKLW